LVEANKTMYGNNEDVPDKLMDIFLLRSPGLINHVIWQVGATDPVFPKSYQTFLNKREFSIHNSMTQPVQYSLYTMPTFLSIYDKPGDGWDQINTDNYFKNYFKTSDMGDVVQQENKSTTPQQFEEDQI
jgi:hypothetical protein